MRPTRVAQLLAVTVGAAVVGLVLAVLAYGSFPTLPRTAPVVLVLLAVFELGLARVVRQRRRSRLHPLQVARSAALAKASSQAGAVLLGLYAGVLAHVAPLHARATDADALVCLVSATAALLLVVAALLLERGCRLPDDGPRA